MGLAFLACASVDEGKNANEKGAVSPSEDAAIGPHVDAPGSFTDLNGFRWFYTTRDNTRFRDITAKLDALKGEGTRVIGIYSPYNGNVDGWLGVDAYDFYATTPACGTVEDFRSLVTTAHQKGMKVVAYFADIYIDAQSDFFEKAQDQYRRGEKTSREAAAVHWTDDPKEALPSPAPGVSCEKAEDDEEKQACTQWRFSQKAGAYYYSLWGQVGFDFNLAGARAEVTRLTKFWLDTGLDGFMFDAGLAADEIHEFMVDIPKSYTQNEKWLTFESAGAEEQTKLDRYGLTTWFNAGDNDEENDYSAVVRGAPVSDLEDSLHALDFAHGRGKTTMAWSILDGSYPNERAMRPQEAALLAGAGMHYGSPDEAVIQHIPADARAAWGKVLVTVNANKALFPSASRKRVPTSGGKSYAMVRTSKDGGQTALLVYNFESAAKTIVLSLAGTGIATSQVPKDLHGGQSMPALTGASYSVQLPAYGFAFLEVRKD